MLLQPESSLSKFRFCTKYGFLQIVDCSKDQNTEKFKRFSCRYFFLVEVTFKSVKHCKFGR